MRLTVLRRGAALTAIDGVIARHRSVRDLVENRWLHLFAIADDGSFDRYAGDHTWIKEPTP